jgi:5-methylcytosine-specific restriction enzyme subunit McrC
MNLLEIFISMFVTEVAVLVKQGLKSSYNSVEDNERFFKGKLNVPQNTKLDYVSKERFYVRYDEWSINRPENRLLKATLDFLRKQSSDNSNRHSISRLLTYFESVPTSPDNEADFSKCSDDRSLSHYQKALSWCKVFLRGNSFTAFAGSEVAVAFLFPMEKVFESYIAAKLRHIILPDVELRMQDVRYSLFDCPTRAFNLRPDIALKDRDDIIVMDTKWKILSENVRNFGISQADMYQMYAYSKKYDASKITLLYPQPGILRGTDISFFSDDGVNVEVCFIDLLHPDESVAAVVKACS